MTRALLPILSVLLISVVPKVFAQTPAAIEHQRLSRQFVEQKNWQKARDEAKLATVAAPTAELNRDAWLLLAATEERLGNLSEATAAYAKYLSLSPSADKKEVVGQRLAELELEVDRYQSYKWGARSAGLILGYSPVFQSQTKDQIAGDMSTAMELGFRVSNWSFGYRKGVGKAGVFKAPTTTTLNSPYANVAAGARHVIEEIYAQYDLELTSQPERQAIVWSVPFFMAVAGNSIRTATTPEKLYVSFGYNIASGLAVNFYTKSAVSFDVAALYHVGIPFTKMKSSDDARPIKTAAGEEIDGSTSGAEVRIGIKILFGTTPPSEDK